MRMAAATWAKWARACATFFADMRIEATISERFRFSVVTLLVSGIRAHPMQGYSPVAYWSIFSGSAIGTALLAPELLKTWGLA
jgi:hypothetical protein